MHEAMVKAHYGINKSAGAVGRPTTLLQYQSQVEQLEIEFFDAFTLAAVYLTNHKKTS
jgi:hypothetical protein